MKQKIFITITILTILMIIIILSFINKPTNKPEKKIYTLLCEYNETDVFKNMTQRYTINIDKFSIINKIKYETIYNYKEKSTYESAKEFFQNENVENDLVFDDESKQINDSYYLNEKEYNNQSYYKYIEGIDDKYKCDKIEFELITYKCYKSKKDEYNSFEETYIINSNNKMNIESINKSEVIKFFDDKLYKENKVKGIEVPGKKYDDDTSSVIYNERISLVDEINIQSYINSMEKDEYECKIVKD